MSPFFVAIMIVIVCITILHCITLTYIVVLTETVFWAAIKTKIKPETEKVSDVIINGHKTQGELPGLSLGPAPAHRREGDMLWLCRYSGEGGTANINTSKIQTKKVLFSFYFIYFSISKKEGCIDNWRII